MDPILFDKLFGDDDDDWFAATASDVHFAASLTNNSQQSGYTSEDESSGGESSQVDPDESNSNGDDGQDPGNAFREDPEGSLGTKGDRDFSEGDESDAGTLLNEGLPAVMKTRLHTSTPADRQRHNFSWSSTEIDEPIINTSGSDNNVDARTLDALPTIDLVNREEAIDISRLFDSDVETEAARLSDPTSPPIPNDDRDPSEEGVHNFSTTARKGSSSNASLMLPGSRDRSPIHRDTPRPSDDDEPESNAKLDLSDDDLSDEDRGATSQATTRELRRLADHNNPGLTEARTKYGPRARRNIRYEKE